MIWLTLTAFLSLFSSVSKALPVIEFDSDLCNNVEQVNQEMIQLELAGARWQAGNSQCLKQERFKTVLAVKEFLRGRSFLKPIYVLPKNRHVEIMNEKWDDTLGQMTLSIRYLDHKDRRVTDELTYQMNFGKNRIAKGCATLIRNPEYFVMSEECLDSGKKKPGRGISSESGH